MAVAWITEIQNLSHNEYAMWCDVPPGPAAYLGVFNGDVYGNNKVPIIPGTRYHVEWCAVPWSDGKHYRYLSGPRGVVRMYCATFADADKLVFVNDSSGDKIGDLPVGPPQFGYPERVWFSLIIEEDGINWEARYGDAIRRKSGMTDKGATLARALINVLG